ncbi:MAG: hypothetical protein L0387_16470 [Acidobacteria bacterium]|nr:hypothetical protein [Acidobacteriota bacterium]
MKVTKRKLQANRHNAEQSPGPKTTAGLQWASKNSRTHGFFAKVLQFDSDEEAAEYRALLTALTASLKPLGAGEELLVARLATLAWNGRKVMGLLQRQLGGYERPQLDPQLAKFIEESDLPEVVIPGLQRPGDGARSDDCSPWECREMVLKVTSGNQEREGTRDPAHSEMRVDSNSEAKGFHMEARFGQAVDTLLRYHTTLERSFERTLNQLLKLQILRRNVVIDGKG